jgi:DNA-binding NarL/FixJ family response regulator
MNRLIGSIDVTCLGIDLVLVEAQSLPKSGLSERACRSRFCSPPCGAPINISSEPVSESPIRVLLLLENRLLREALARLLRRRADLFVVASFGKEECSPDRPLVTQFDVMVLDFLDTAWLPINLGLKTAGLAAQKVLLISMSDDTDQFLAAVRGGVTAYLLKEASIKEVLEAVRSTFRGEAVCPPQLCGFLFHHVAHMARSRSVPPLAERPNLTLRQQQLVGLVAKGLTNKEIASRLSLSEYTVKNHLSRIMKQVDAESRGQAVRAILSHGYSLNSYEGSV